MSGGINDKSITQTLTRNLEDARKEQADALEKLSSGQIFTSLDPRPAERAIAEGLNQRLHSLAAAKKNVNDAVSLLQTAESSFVDLSDIITRMKEISVAATNGAMNDREKRFFFMEYEALFNEVNRLAQTTEFNGLPILNGASEDMPEKLIFRLDDPFKGSSSNSGGGATEDLNVLVFSGLKSIVTTTEGLGLKSAADLLANTLDGEALDPDDLLDLMRPDDEDRYSTSFEQALDLLGLHRATYGAMQSRLQRALDFVDVYQENISAAKSRIADTDYARESARLAQSQILLSATTGLIAHSNAASSLTLNLLAGLT